MERDFNRDGFERLLKEKSDEFRMYPSNRVWNSIYNNFHPSRKWPSVAMSITLISTLLVVGYLNTNSSHNNGNNDKTAKTVKSHLLADNSGNKNRDNKITLTKTNTAVTTTRAPASGFSKAGTAVLQPSSFNKNANDVIAVTGNKTTLMNNITAVNNYSQSGNALAATPSVDNDFSTTAESLPSSVKLTEPAGVVKLDWAAEKETTNGSESLLQQVKLRQAELSLALNANKVATTQLEAASGLTQDQKSWIENYALHNRPAARKWKGKLAWQGYFTPSVVYRSLHNNINVKNATEYYGFSGRQFYTNPSNAVTHKPSFGFEAGAGLQYNLLKWAKVRAGFQLNYTRYSIMAHKNSHPSSTTITMIDEETGLPYEVFRSATYSNLYGVSPVKLHNQTFQLSVPVGLDVRIGRYENIELYAAGSVQPGLVLGGSSYLISSDRQNYISESSMINHFNVNTAVELYVSYKTNNGYTWQLGPQYRSQLFSTNSKFYSTGEKLLNYGFKIGVSKKL